MFGEPVTRRRVTFCQTLHRSVSRLVISLTVMFVCLCLQVDVCCWIAFECETGFESSLIIFEFLGSNIASFLPQHRPDAPTFATPNRVDVIFLFLCFYFATGHLLDSRVFEKCTKTPIREWLIGSYAVIAVFRLSQLYEHYVRHYTRNETLQKVAYKTLIMVFVPLVLAWVTAGAVIVNRSDDACLPRGRRQSMIWMIIVSYIYLMSYVVGLCASEHMASNLQDMSDEEMQTAVRRVLRLQRMGIPVARNNGDGLTDMAIQAIETKTYHRETEARDLNDVEEGEDGQDHEDEGDMCSICLTELTEGETIRDIPCKHMFHMECMDRWLSVKASCPNCNQRIVEGTQEQEGVDSSDELAALV